MRTLVTVLVCAVAYLAYRSVDQAVSLDHSRASARELADEQAILRALVLEFGRGANRDVVKRALEKVAGSHLVKDDGEVLSVLGLTFRFEGSGRALADVGLGFELGLSDSQRATGAR